MGSLEKGNLSPTGNRNDSVKYSSKLAGLLEIHVFGIRRQPKNCPGLYMKIYCFDIFNIVSGGRGKRRVEGGERRITKNVKADNYKTEEGW